MTHNRESSKLHSWFVAHHGNNHHPHLLRGHGLLIAILVLIALQFVYNFAATGQPRILGYATNISVEDVHAHINSARLQNNLPELQVDYRLTQATMLKAQDMLDKNYWSHVSPSGEQPWRWVLQVGYNYGAAGENLAKGFNTSRAMAAAWLNSETHRDNILSPNYQDIGIAIVNGYLDNKPTTLVVTMFGSPRTVLASTNESPPAVTSLTDTRVASVFNSPALVSSLMSPISLISLFILLTILMVAALTHWHYIKLPRDIRRAWYHHHALYTLIFSAFVISYIAYIFTAGTI